MPEEPPEAIPVVRVRRVRAEVPAYGKVLYARNHLAICRGVSFGLLGTAPFLVAAFLWDFPGPVRYLLIALQSFGVLDLLVFFAYQDKLNDMFHSRVLRRHPAGCQSHSCIGLAQSCLFLALVGALGFFGSPLLPEHFVLLSVFCLEALLYFMALCSLKSVIAYLVILAALVWFVLALLLGGAACFLLLATCGKVLLGRRQRYLKQQTRFLTFSLVKRLRERGSHEFCCSVCLEDLRPGDRALELPCDPKAHHFFHHKCGTQWLHTHHTCPMCRKDYQEAVLKPSLWQRLWLYRDIDI